MRDPHRPSPEPPPLDPAAYRRTTQDLAPRRWTPTPRGRYDIHPTYPVASGAVAPGHEAIAAFILATEAPVVAIDGYAGVLWSHFEARLAARLDARGRRPTIRRMIDACRDEAEIEGLVEPFLGGDDPIFGRRFTGRLSDFLDPDRRPDLAPEPGDDLVLVIGPGASLVAPDAPLVYVDVPKNEIQFRQRAGAVTVLGARTPDDQPKRMYKRSYFVDWVALNRHKREIVDRVDLWVDEQRPEDPASARGEVVRAALDAMSRTWFRARPWFEPGPWGGQWIKERIPNLPDDPPNYAWSFELIVPENGLVIGGPDEARLELSFDWLMYRAGDAVLGPCRARFGDEFPIRFDFLDTVRGGNLSLQCHPRPDFIRDEFGETFTQDECYYIRDAEPDARVYLGFREDIDPAAFRADLDRSVAEGTPVDVERHVRTLPARRHDLFLIPSGTVHCSGVGSLVLEISATPYIFTFKMYDWLRLDLEGRPRPLNLDRAFANLRFDRRGGRVERELVSRPEIVSEEATCRLVRLPTHPEHFYEVYRAEFDDRFEAETAGSCHVLSLVEGTSIALETPDGRRQRFNFAETFVVPAAAERYMLVNEGPGRAFVVRASVKPDFEEHQDDA